uniref:Cap-specific mRNA (nucleoside-2'-O-)-methyltransferase 1 n=2 Tax=Trichuris muris TaxID=70415 RepID=A0A5S6QRY8_TRIMR
MDGRKRTAEAPSSLEDDAKRYRKHAPSLGSKRPADDSVAENSKGWKLMKRMGYKEGTGLGTSEQGIAEPIRPQMQFGRSGLGRKTGLEHSLTTTWDTDKEQVEIREMPEFFPKCSHGCPAENELTDGIVVGDRRYVMNDETEFCSKDVLLAMLESKNVFDEVDDYQLRNARSRANPFESIRGLIFQNRAAMKMANLDAVFDFRLTNPVDSNGVSLVPKAYNNEEFFYFADICAGPGGFTEYVLWKRGWTARGFGMTLRGKDDFRLDNFLSASPEMFEPFYGSAGDGDVTKGANLDSFREFVLQGTGGRGVHLIMADGGFSVEGQENIQEILSKRLYLCQSLCALMVLGDGGNFVCKLFDTFTVFTVGLLYLLWRCFDQMCIHKPHTSRPANSERYLVCLGLRPNVEAVRKYLYKANEQFAACNPAEDLIELVPLATLLDDAKFCEHIRSLNDKLAERQTVFLRKYKAFAENPTLRDTRQSDFRTLCLKYWQMPDESRPPKPSRSPDETLRRLVKDPSALRRCVPVVTLDALGSPKSFSNHLLFPIYGKVRLIVSVGNGRAFFFADRRWMPVIEGDCPLPKDTVILGDICYRMRSELPTRKTVPVLRVLDAFCLDKVFVDKLPYSERMLCARKLCTAVSKLQENQKMLRLMVADGWSTKKAHEMLSQPFEQIRFQGIRYPVIRPGANEDWFYLLQQFYFLPVLKGPWSLRVGREVEYFNNETKKCETEISSDVVYSFCRALENGLCLSLQGMGDSPEELNGLLKKLKNIFASD